MIKIDIAAVVIKSLKVIVVDNHKMLPNTLKLSKQQILDLIP